MTRASRDRIERGDVVEVRGEMREVKAVRRKERRPEDLVLVFTSGPALRVRTGDVSAVRRGQWRVR
ncbi:hypothetical protein AF335_12650 [Streptomyces eurocidicus]|uniref:Uncharacterized protein n=1 Tax=Streptomyces eurocidicus TaxID=66423 RepID=A0A2N8NY36_STREU|nr:hypothetical protein [Streptomyces eurocidicus]MBB5119787.1 hypothetical protein [Streptomyces eurocidicus]MBF6050808.1 hypothetical protein [Streptomyces eurocidicus]PNE33674.1 hypothetical protein AF335_12650 [Streptomyces eurocidicus]